MQHTTNYNLTIFEQNDVPSWLSDWNGNMTDIDTAIAAAKVAADGAQSTASGAQNASEQNASAIESLSTTVTQQGGTLTNLAGAVNTINSLIGNGTPTTTDQTIIGAINEINAAYKVAANIVFTPGASGMQSTNVEDAIKEAYAHGGAGTVTAADVTYDNTSSGLSATNAQAAIDEVYAAIPAQQTVNVRWNSTTDRFEVLKNGSWVQSIRAFVNSLAVFVAGVFGITMDNGAYNPSGSTTATAFTLANDAIESNSQQYNSLVSDSKIDFTNYAAVKVKYVIGTDPEQTLTVNVSALSGEYYLALGVNRLATVTNSTLDVILSSTKENYATSQAAQQTATATGNQKFTITEITVE